jgi:hypothetical protein
VKNICSILFLFLTITCSLHSQVLSETQVLSNEKPRRNAVYLELGGHGGIFSVNYERMLLVRPGRGIAARIGLGNATAYTALAEIDALFGDSIHWFEPGLGYMHPFDQGNNILSFRAGYRYQGKKGFLFRIAPMYLFNFEVLKGNTDVFDGFWLGLSLGYRF